MDAALTRSQAVRMVAFGLLVWFIGAIMVRFARQFDLLGALMPVTYLATLPIMIVTVWLGKRIGGLQGPQYLSGVALATAAAIACDGLVIPLYPALYGGPGEDLARGAAWILFAGAMGFVAPLWSLAKGQR